MQCFSTQLTSYEATYLQTLLPKGYSLQIAALESKRNRPAKKLDESFIADFIIDTKRTVNKQTNQSSNQKLEAHSQSDPVSQANKKTSTVKESADRLNHAKNGKNHQVLDQGSLIKLLEDLKNCKHSWPFLLPVDPVAQGVPNYFDIIKNPMDLNTIEKKLKQGSYTYDGDFHLDVERIISNSYLFNPKQTKIYSITQKFEAFYHNLYQNIEKSPNNTLSRSARINEEGEFEGDEKMGKNNKRTQRKHHLKTVLSQQKNGDLISNHPTKASLTIVEKMTQKDLQNLLHKIYELPQSQIIKLIKIVDPGNLPGDWKEFEIDFKDIDDATYKRIIKLVNNKDSQ